MVRSAHTKMAIANLLVALFFVLSCGGKESFTPFSGDSGSTPSPSPTPTPTPTSNSSSPNGGPSGSTLDTTGFWIAGEKAGSIPYTIVTREDTDYADFCEIPTGTLDQEIDCIIDVEENDLHVQGLGLRYNVPGEMCTYLVRFPYYYFDLPVGVGPTSVRIVKTYDAADDFASAQCEVNGGGLGACNSLLNDETEFGTINGTVTEFACVYDCCIGDYTYTLEEDHTASPGGTYDVSDPEDRSWGEDYSSCIGGAGKISWSSFFDNGRPAGVIHSIDETSGLNGVHSLTAPLSNLRPSNVELANYYSPIHTHSGFSGPAPTSDLAFFLDPIDDLSGDTIASGFPSYTFYCLDRAREVRNIINVYIRDWDTLEEFESYVTTDGVSGNPDLGLGDEGVDCNGILGKCNDYYDLDDLLNFTFGGSYSTATPGLRDGYFPKETDED